MPAIEGEVAGEHSIDIIVKQAEDFLSMRRLVFLAPLAGHFAGDLNSELLDWLVLEGI